RTRLHHRLRCLLRAGRVPARDERRCAAPRARAHPRRAAARSADERADDGHRAGRRLRERGRAPELRPRVSETGLSELAARIREAVDAVAAADPNPAAPFRGFYITDEAARSLAGEQAEDALDARLADAARLLGLSRQEAAILGVCAAPHLSPRYG